MNEDQENYEPDYTGLDGLEGGEEDYLGIPDEDADPQPENTEGTEQPVEAAQEPQIAPMRPYIPRQVNGNSNEIAAQLREAIGNDELYGLLDGLMNARVQEALSAHTVYGTYEQQLTSEFPELMREYGPAIREVGAQIPPSQRGTPEAALLAAFSPVLQEAQQTGDVGAALRKFAEKIVGGKPVQAARPVAPQPPPKPATGTGGQAIRQPVQNKPAGGKRNVLSEQYGMSALQQALLASDPIIGG